MMNFAEDPGLIISDGIVFNGLVSHLLSESIDNLDFFKVQDDTAAGTTWDVLDLIGLQGDLDWEVFGDKGNHEVETGLSP